MGNHIDGIIPLDTSCLSWGHRVTNWRPCNAIRTIHYLYHVQIVYIYIYVYTCISSINDALSEHPTYFRRKNPIVVSVIYILNIFVKNLCCCHSLHLDELYVVLSTISGSWASNQLDYPGPPISIDTNRYTKTMNLHRNKLTCRLRLSHLDNGMGPLHNISRYHYVSLFIESFGTDQLFFIGQRHRVKVWWKPAILVGAPWHLCLCCSEECNKGVPCKASQDCRWGTCFAGKPRFYIVYLVGGLEHVLFFHILGIIIPIDSYFSEGFSQPPTSYSGTSMKILLT